MSNLENILPEMTQNDMNSKIKSLKSELFSLNSEIFDQNKSMRIINGFLDEKKSILKNLSQLARRNPKNPRSEEILATEVLCDDDLGELEFELESLELEKEEHETVGEKDRQKFEDFYRESRLKESIGLLKSES